MYCDALQLQWNLGPHSNVLKLIQSMVDGEHSVQRAVYVCDQLIG